MSHQPPVYHAYKCKTLNRRKDITPFVPFLKVPANESTTRHNNMNYKLLQMAVLSKRTLFCWPALLEDPNMCGSVIIFYDNAEYWNTLVMNLSTSLQYPSQPYAFINF